jgi:hypothetical protein
VNISQNNKWWPSLNHNLEQVYLIINSNLNILAPFGQPSSGLGGASTSLFAPKPAAPPAFSFNTTGAGGQTSSSLFGKPTISAAPSLFGGSTATTTPQQSASIFGTTTTASAAPARSFFLCFLLIGFNHYKFYTRLSLLVPCFLV